MKPSGRVPADAFASVSLATLLVGVGAFAAQPGVVRVAPAQTQNRIETYDDLLLRVEERVPGFGGMFMDADKRLVVYLTDPTRLPAARQAIEAVFGAQRVPPAGVRAVRGQYTISQLKSWSKRANAILDVPGVTMVDLDEARNRVAIGVDRPSRTAAVERALPSLNIPREAVTIQVTGQIQPTTRQQSR